MKNNDLIKLGIALDYPVNWSVEMVIPDLMQNFYDAIGPDRFKKDFVYTISGNGPFECIMESGACSFSYEWLNYIGASTKTESAGKYVGMYGEGFKICMLRLMQLSVDRVAMESRDWMILPCVYEEKLSGRYVKMLGYRCLKREDDGMTRLTINGLPFADAKKLKEIILNFFYIGNPLFGGKIVADTTTSLYKRSCVICPSDYHDTYFNGVLYINGLARARLDIPLIICINRNTLDEEHRNREILFSFQGKRLLAKHTMKLDARVSYYFLVQLRDYWNDRPDGDGDADTWYYIVCNLVRNVSYSKRYRNLFEKNYMGLYYIERPITDNKRIKIIKETEVWVRSVRKNKRNRVIPVFRHLGAKSMVDEYLMKKEKMYRACTIDEKIRLQILFDFVEVLQDKKTLYDDRPEILVVDENSEDKAGAIKPDPLQFAVRDYSCENIRKYRIEKLVMKHEDIVIDDFITAFLNLFEKLIYARSGERSKTRAYVLTDLANRIICMREKIKFYEEKWKDVGKITI